MDTVLNITRENGVRQALKVTGNKINMVFFDCHDVKLTISCLKKYPKRIPLAACLNVPCEESFALLYDFVDAFVISGYDDLSETVDPLINLRLYNDQYKEIYLRIPDNYLTEDLDEVLAYSMLSNVDALVISNPELLKYAVKKSGNILKIIADGIDSHESMEECCNNGAQVASIPYTRRCILPFSIYMRLRKIL